MQKLTYANDDQFISDATTLLLKAHLRWSNTDKNMPSEDLDNVHGQMVEAYREAHFTVWEWLDTDAELREEFDGRAEVFFHLAAELADRRWREALDVLGIAA